jgi:uncharacterized tellurite resistance protein B-like protein
MLIDHLARLPRFPKITAFHVPDLQGMIASIQDFFNRHIASGSTVGDRDQQALPIAAAALLIEMMRMDDEVKDTERQAIVASLQSQFKLDAARIESLMALAEQEVRDANGYFQFTSLINKHFDHARKVQIIESL